MKKILGICLSVFIIFLLLSCQKSKNETGDAGMEFNDIIAKIDSLSPKEGDFRFVPPANWSDNLLKNASIIGTNEDESMDSLLKIIDGNPATKWQSNSYNPRPEVLVDLKKKMKFNRIVIFNRFTDSRGTGGGNNATKEIEILLAKDNNPDNLTSIGSFTLAGPKAVCFKEKNKGKVCVFIDNIEPNIIEINDTEARLLKLIFKSAYWGDIAPDEWKSSVALSEVMLYNAQ